MKSDITEQIGLRVTPEMRAALEEASEYEARTMHDLIRVVLAWWLREHGYLPNGLSSVKGPR